jgi:endonuclease-3
MMSLCFGPMNRAEGPLFGFPHATAGPSAQIRAVGRCDILRGMKTTEKKSAKASKPSRLTHGAPTVTAGTSRMRLRGTNPVRVKAILEGLDEMYPAATCELKHANPFQLLISTIMSAQCTDVRVNEVAKTLYVKYPTANHFAYANPSELEQEIRPTGFFRNKTKSIMGASKAIVEQFDGKVPQTMDELLNLPGVARKTANVVLGSGFGIASGVVVDTHVIRLSNRLDLTKHSDPKKIELDLIKIIPQDKWVIFSHQLIWHGRRLCAARKPRCAECKIEHLCYAKDKTI